MSVSDKAASVFSSLAFRYIRLYFGDRIHTPSSTQSTFQQGVDSDLSLVRWKSLLSSLFLFPLSNIPLSVSSLRFSRVVSRFFSKFRAIPESCIFYILCHEPDIQSSSSHVPASTRLSLVQLFSTLRSHIETEKTSPDVLHAASMSSWK